MPYRSVFRPGLFKEQVVVVTGGGSGIGRCIAHELTALGAHAVLLGRTEEKLQRVAAEITEDGGSASYHVCDIREEEQVKRAVTGNGAASKQQVQGMVRRLLALAGQPGMDEADAAALAYCHLERTASRHAALAPVVRLRRTSRWTASDVERLRAEGRVR